MAQFFPMLTTVKQERIYRVRILGVNGANPTKQEGDGVTVTRTSEGLYKVTWAKNPYQFIGWSFGFGSATMDDLIDYSCVRGVFNTTAFTMAFSVYKQNGTVEDLVANQYLDLTLVFSESGT